MPKRYTSGDLRRIVEADGWLLVAQKGSHLQFKHPRKQGRVTIPAHRGTMKPGTAASVLRQAGLKSR